jgi:membrane protease YdiL (CAAX protease family)
MKPKNLSTHGFAVFCFVLAIYLSVGGWLQTRLGWGGIILNQIGILLMPAILYTKFMGLDWRELFPLRRPTLKDTLMTLILTALVIAAIEGMVMLQQHFLPLPQQIEAFYENLLKRDYWWQGLWQVVALALVPALCEELFFRGFIQGTMEGRYGVWLSMILTAVFFSLAHMNPWYFPYYFLLGLYLGWLRVWSGALTLSILAHLMNNLYSLFAY